MSEIKPYELPVHALLEVYAKTDGCFTDCYATTARSTVSLSRYVAAFYTTPLFKAERLVLKYAASRPSTDDEAIQVAEARADAFAAWRVEKRTDNQLLMCDMSGRTRSWFMVEPVPDAGPATRLYFGSAVVPVLNERTGKRSLGFAFSALLGFHKLYSRALLSAAKARLTA